LQKENQHRQNIENEDRDGCPVQNLPVDTLVAVQTASGTGRESCKCNKKNCQSLLAKRKFTLFYAGWLRQRRERRRLIDFYFILQKTLADTHV
jgi:hypothetical protein